jgi:hypothetical protein
MPQSNFTMWGMLILMAFGAALSAGLFSGNLSLRGAYPSEPAKQDALRRCARMDAQFSRFSEHDRDICYRSLLSPARHAASPPATFER